MNAPFQSRAGDESFFAPADACRVATIYQDGAAISQVLTVFRRLGGNFHDELDFIFASWGFDELHHSGLSNAATEAASQADILVFATHGALPGEARAWLENLVKRRRNREGALVLLVAEPVDVTAQIMALLMLLEDVALRAGMDFLPLFPSAAEGSFINVAERPVEVSHRGAASAGRR